MTSASAFPGVVDSHVLQVPDAPALTVDVDRTLAQQAGVDQAAVANNVLVTANISSAQTAPNFWVDPAKQRRAIRLVAQMPTYKVNSADDLRTLPIMPVTPTIGEKAKGRC